MSRPGRHPGRGAHLEAWQRGRTGVPLVDASNPFNWQWVAGSGADAAPYFRIFNPELQAKKFDPSGAYIAEWAPEYADPDASIPVPIVDLRESRSAALAAYEEVRRAPR